MEINRYITRGINDMIPLEIQIMMWEMVRLRDKIMKIREIIFIFLD